MSLLQTTELSKRFGEIQAVNGVSFAVKEGEIYGLLGPNGAGKTTTLSMVCGLLKPDGGKVLIDGANFWTDPAKSRRVMGVVPQEIALYEDMTGRENLEFWGRIAGLPKTEAKSRAGTLLEALGLVDRARDLVKKYSGGMKRRINLGCALMHQPRLLLLDEPTVGIDPQARANILEFIKGLVVEGMGLLYTTHYLEEAETLCDRIGIIDHGRLLAEGTLPELQKLDGEQHLFAVEGALEEADPSDWDGFEERFRVIQKDDRVLTVAPIGNPDPAQSLKELLALPARIENVTLKRPSLNDTFLRLTGRELRE
jgi:ABC-2 type transport system ATP-binding protein